MYRLNAELHLREGNMQEVGLHIEMENTSPNLRIRIQRVNRP